MPATGSGGGWGTPQTPRAGRSKGPIYLAVIAAVAVIAAIIVVVVVSGGGGSHSATSTTSSTAAKTTTTAGGLGTSTTGAVPSVTTPPTTAAATPSLISLLPTDLDTSTCQAVTSPPTGLTGLSQALGCGAPAGLPGGSVFAYQFTNPTTFKAGLDQYNKDKGFDVSTAGQLLPPLRRRRGGYHLDQPSEHPKRDHRVPHVATKQHLYGEHACPYLDHHQGQRHHRGDRIDDRDGHPDQQLVPVQRCTPMSSFEGTSSIMPGGGISRRPLDFFILADCSGSMTGEKIQALNFAIADMLPHLAIWERDQEQAAMRVRRWRSGTRPFGM